MCKWTQETWHLQPLQICGLLQQRMEKSKHKTNHPDNAPQESQNFVPPCILLILVHRKNLDEMNPLVGMVGVKTSQFG